VDTHALVWAVSSPELLSNAALVAFENEEIVVSVASLWELALKSGKKNALVADPVPWWRKYVMDKRCVHAADSHSRRDRALLPGRNPQRSI
jgi:PIN domain nuclease of toxin-antitoxin system